MEHILKSHTYKKSKVILINKKHIIKFLSHVLKFKKVIFIVFFSLNSFQLFSQANVYVLKAVYLEKFSRFVSWPNESLMNDKKEPFVIAVIGETPLGENLEQIYAVQKINDKSVIIKRISNLHEIENSHILVIADSERKNLKNILNFTKDLPILTISDASGFADKGVLINFYEEKNKLRFEINETAVLRSPLQISFYLLNSAKIVHPAKEN